MMAERFPQNAPIRQPVRQMGGPSRPSAEQDGFGEAEKFSRHRRYCLWNCLYGETLFEGIKSINFLFAGIPLVELHHLVTAVHFLETAIVIEM